MRVGAAMLWPDPFADFSLNSMGQSYEAAYTLPPRWDGDRKAFEWDGDRWPINVIGHGLFGSELYLKARQCRHSEWLALAVAAGGSVAWEYAIEASAVRPSGLDLVYTPLAGALLGEARFWGYRWARSLSGGSRAFLATLFDPLGEFERALGTDC
jgi:hypothetical protein